MPVGNLPVSSKVLVAFLSCLCIRAELVLLQVYLEPNKTMTLHLPLKLTNSSKERNPPALSLVQLNFKMIPNHASQLKSVSNVLSPRL